MPRGSPRSINYGFTCQSVAEIWGWQHPVLLGKVQETEYGDNARIEFSFLSRTSGPYLLTYCRKPSHDTHRSAVFGLDVVVVTELQIHELSFLLRGRKEKKRKRENWGQGLDT